MIDVPFAGWLLPEVAKENDDLNRGYFERGEMDNYPYFSKLYEAILEIKQLSDPIVSNAEILDVGCGTGWQIVYLDNKKLGYRFSGIDISFHMCERARKNCPLSDFYVEDIFNFFPNRLWDIVMACGSIEHFEEWEKFINKLANLSKKWVLIHKIFFTDNSTEKIVRTQYCEIPEIRMVLNWQEFQNKVASLGLRIVKKEDWAGYVSSVVLEKINAES